jgi:L-ascorbate metabolism protein UlaG (beta-lactamase superfamily)
MSGVRLQVTYIGGPTALLELGGLRLLTDPTFDPAGSEYPSPATVLRKTQDPALSAEAVGAVDIVLLSHDHHFDNLDHGGRRALATAGQTLTTMAGAERLGGNAVGLAPGRAATFRERMAGCFASPPRRPGTGRPAGTADR